MAAPEDEDEAGGKDPAEIERELKEVEEELEELLEPGEDREDEA